jgi:Nucleotidyl transferase AbiEii toxin, Type IV TA system
MHPKVLSADAWKTIRLLRAENVLESWTLAGGTALALQIGHRYSEDLGFFRTEAFEPERLAVHLSTIGRVSIQSRAAETLHAVLAGLRISFLRAQVPLLFLGTAYRGLTLADPRDIAVMKLIAIGGRGSRRDFIDLYFYLHGDGDLEGLFSLLRSRFRDVDFNEYHLLKSLVYFDDAESEPMPRMIRGVEWETIKRAIAAEVRRLS